MKDLKTNIDEIDLCLTKLFNNTISNEKIEKVRYERYADNYCKNYNQNFLFKYLTEILTNKDELKLGMEEQSNLRFSFYCSFFWSFFMSFCIFMFMGTLLFNLDFVFIITISSFSLIFLGINTFKYFKTKENIRFSNKNIELNLEYNRDFMVNMFLKNSLINTENYFKNEKMKKEDLEGILKFIKSYMTVEQITNWLTKNKVNDISDPLVLYKLLLKIKSEKVEEYNKLEKEKIEKENTDKNKKILDSVN